MEEDTHYVTIELVDSTLAAGANTELLSVDDPEQMAIRQIDANEANFVVTDTSAASTSMLTDAKVDMLSINEQNIERTLVDQDPSAPVETEASNMIDEEVINCCHCQLNFQKSVLTELSAIVPQFSATFTIAQGFHTFGFLYQLSDLACIECLNVLIRSIGLKYELEEAEKELKMKCGNIYVKQQQESTSIMETHAAKEEDRELHVIQKKNQSVQTEEPEKENAVQNEGASAPTEKGATDFDCNKVDQADGALNDLNLKKEHKEPVQPRSTRGRKRKLEKEQKESLEREQKEKSKERGILKVKLTKADEARPNTRRSSRMQAKREGKTSKETLMREKTSKKTPIKETPKVNQNSVTTDLTPVKKKRISLSKAAQEDISYECSVCSKVFTHATNHEKHFLKEHPMACRVCGEIGESKNIVQIHYKAIHDMDEFNYICKFCSKKFLKGAYIDRHMHYHLQTYQCEHCSKCFCDSHDLRKHSIVHMKKSPGVRNSGGTRAGSPATRRKSKDLQSENSSNDSFVAKHESSPPMEVNDGETVGDMKNISKVEPYEPSSGVESSSIADASDMYTPEDDEGDESFSVPGTNKQKGRSDLSYNCSICDSSFRSRILVKRHMDEHTNTCNYCEEQFPDKELLNTHVETHKGEKMPYSCPVCKKKFAKKGFMYKHMDIHTGRYRCYICSKCFSDSHDLRGHGMTHDKELYLDKEACICKFCLRQFFTETELTEHLKLHFEKEVNKTYVCHKCFVEFSTTKELAEHLPSCEKAKPATPLDPKEKYRKYRKKQVCEICGKVTESLKLHMQTHMGIDRPKPYSCEVCGKKFSLDKLRMYHMRTHTGERPYKCSKCGKAFITIATLKQHEQVHSDQKQFKCGTCGKAFKRPGHLKEHEVTHTEYRPFECDKCPAKFHLKTGLRSHMLIHNNIYPYECSECKKPFRNSGSLKVHMRTHTGEKPFKCMLCGRGFLTKQILDKHMTVHTGEKNYACSVCMKTFAHESSAKQHLLVHTNEYAYQCKLCHKRFKTSSSLARHKKNVHGLVSSRTQQVQQVETKEEEGEAAEAEFYVVF